MTAPQQARNALERAVEAQRAQRQAAQESRKPVTPQQEEGVENAETDRQE